MIPSWIGGLTELDIFDLKNAWIDSLTDEVFSLKKLSILKLTSNIKELSPLIGNLVDLNELTLEMPNLSTLPDSMLKLNGLTSL